MTKLEDLKVNIEEVKNEYLQKLEEIKAKIEELKQEYELEEETDNRWKPRLGEDYWWVDIDGIVYRDRWDNVAVDNAAFNHSDIFPTEQQAEFDSERKRIRRELMKYGRTFDPSVRNWKFSYNYPDKTIYYLKLKYLRDPFAIYFESQEMAKKAVEEVGADRIKKYLFGVE